MEKRQGSITTKLFLFTMLSMFIVLSLYTVFSLWAFHRSSEGTFRERAKFEQTLFADSITSDLASGAFLEVRRKCEHLYSSGRFSAVLVADAQGKPVCALPPAKSFVEGPNTIERSVFLEREENALLARIKMNCVNVTFNPVFKSTLWLLAALLMMFIPITYYLIRRVVQRCAGPVAHLSEILIGKKLREIPPLLEACPTHSVEMADLIDSIGHMADGLIEAEQCKMDKAHLEGMAEMAAQVVHDINSPISTLNLVIKNAEKLPEHERILIHNATRQITDITSNLMVQNNGAVLGQMAREATSELLFAQLDNLVSAKRIQYSQELVNGLEIDFYVSESAHGVFVKLLKMEFNRVLSSLINNGIEAMKAKGLLEIHLKHFPGINSLQIKIRDTGCGMSKELLSEVFKSGLNGRKKEDHRMGLAASKFKLESCGATFDINSVLGEGTTVTIGLKSTIAPGWFRTRVPIPAKGTLVILNDDPTIHSVWQTRFQKITTEGLDPIKLFHFQYADEFLKANHASFKNVHYLIDYDLLGSQISGLDAIEQLGIGEQATLVTSRYEDPQVRGRCFKLGCRILPKDYAAHAPLMVMPPIPELVFIDSCPLMITTWTMSAERVNHRLLVISNVSEARKIVPLLPSWVPVYVDTSLANGEKGDEFSKELYEMGCRNLYLVTGYEPEKFEAVYWVKAVLGKEYPDDFVPASNNWVTR